MARRSWSVAFALLALATSGCAWVGLGWGAATYPTTQSGEAGNVAALGEVAYVTRGAQGIEIVALGHPSRGQLMRLPQGMETADDLAIADGVLFVLDARPPGHLAAFSLQDPLHPVLANEPVAADVGPFSGVSAARGRVAVSGGTSLFQLRAYDSLGRLSPTIATADLGRGQPDVLLDASGRAFVSTHDWGPYFRMAIAATSVSPAAIGTAQTLMLETYGFTPGGSRPANFPIEAAVDQDVLYVASSAGLDIADVQERAPPRWLAHADLALQAVNVDVLDGIAAVVGSRPEPALVLVDVRDPAHPKVLQTLPLPKGSLATGVALTRSHVVVAAHGQGTLLFDRSSSTWEPIVQSFPSRTQQESTS